MATPIVAQVVQLTLAEVTVQEVVQPERGRPPDGIIALKRGRMSDKDKLDIAALEKATHSRGRRP